ncbi:MAG: carboxymuconolactone decarboxylase family protein [Rubellimicrobium sp.]|nr:carboxymuconolactone decarboxylase family protein [Rubellimicrobium sp.]
MSRLPLRSLENAPAEAISALETAQSNIGFVPNLLRVLANAPVVLESYQTLGALNARAGLDLAAREAVQLTAAVQNDCGFCVAGHTLVATHRAGLEPGVISALRDSGTVPDARLDAVARFTESVIATRGAVSDAELASFKAAGFDDAAALEVVLGVSLATLCNFANNLARPDLNPQLAPYAWGRTAVSVAAE